VRTDLEDRLAYWLQRNAYTKTDTRAAALAISDQQAGIQMLDPIRELDSPRLILTHQRVDLQTLGTSPEAPE
jgi:hypothetical protein